MSVKIALMGAGAMGSALIRGLLAQGAAEATDIIVNEVDKARLDAVVAEHGVSAGPGLPDGASDARVVVLAVKPQSFPALAYPLREALDNSQLVLSIMAGVKLETLTEQLDTGRVVRAMPNIPAQIGRGVSVWMGGATVNAEDRELTRRVLGAVGTEIEVPSESLVDAATAVHGSGPAYVYLVAEAWIDAAVAIGLDHATAETLVRETLAGSAQLWETTGRSPAELRHAVTSPAGTTAAALRVFEEQGLRTAFFDAVEAAFLRSQELG